MAPQGEIDHLDGAANRSAPLFPLLPSLSSIFDRKGAFWHLQRYPVVKSDTQSEESCELPPLGKGSQKWAMRGRLRRVVALKVGHGRRLAESGRAALRDIPQGGGEANVSKRRNLLTGSERLRFRIRGLSAVPTSPLLWLHPNRFPLKVGNQ